MMMTRIQYWNTPLTSDSAATSAANSIKFESEIPA